MATREEYIAASQALAAYVQEKIATIPQHIRAIILQHISMEEIGEKVNDAAVVAVDAAEEARAGVAKPPQSPTKTTP